MEIEVPVVKMRKPRAKKEVAADPPAMPEPVTEPVADPPAAEAVMDPPRKKRVRVKKDELAIVPVGAPHDIPEAEPLPEPPSVAPPPPAEIEGADHDPSFTVVKKKRGPYKPRKPKEETKSDDAVGGAPAAAVELNPNFWLGLDTTIKHMRRQARQDRFANFVIA